MEDVACLGVEDFGGGVGFLLGEGAGFFDGSGADWTGGVGTLGGVVGLKGLEGPANETAGVENEPGTMTLGSSSKDASKTGGSGAVTKKESSRLGVDAPEAVRPGCVARACAITSSLFMFSLIKESQTCLDVRLVVTWTSYSAALGG